MGIGEICLLGVGLSMDAFAVSICKGLQMRKFNGKQALWMGIFFGGFQALMPLTGWLLGALFAKHIMRYSHWIAFVLLAFIGGKMLLEGRTFRGNRSLSQQGGFPGTVFVGSCHFHRCLGGWCHLFHDAGCQYFSVYFVDWQYYIFICSGWRKNWKPVRRPI